MLHQVKGRDQLITTIKSTICVAILLRYTVAPGRDGKTRCTCAQILSLVFFHLVLVWQYCTVKEHCIVNVLLLCFLNSIFLMYVFSDSPSYPFVIYAMNMWMGSSIPQTSSAG